MGIGMLRRHDRHAEPQSKVPSFGEPGFEQLSLEEKLKDERFAKAFEAEMKAEKARAAKAAKAAAKEAEAAAKAETEAAAKAEAEKENQ